VYAVFLCGSPSYTHRITDYQTEPYVAAAIRNAGFDRSELYITTKFSLGDVQDGIRQSLQNVRDVRTTISGFHTYASS
jgi:hypothetical protein